VDRRAASSPDVSDGLVMATGAVLDRDIEEVVLQTRDAVELVRLPLVDALSSAGRRLRDLASGIAPATAGCPGLLVAEEGDPVALPPRFLLTAEAEQVAALLDECPDARWLLVAGALPERFLRSLLHPLRHRGRELALVVGDPTKVFLWKRSPAWYRRQGVHLWALERTALAALTVNPVAPQSHAFDSAELRARMAEAIPDVPVFDVLSADYLAAREVAPSV
jgi:hypothetical protein